MAVEEVVAAASAEGLSLVRADNASGFRNVFYIPESNAYRVQLCRNGKSLYLGAFPTPVEAVLCVARWLRDHAAAGQAAPASTASV